jgi:hypothetical protein
MQIDVSDSHEKNTDSPRVDSRERLSNITEERFLHMPKQDLEMVSIDAGMEIDGSDEQR